MKDPLTRVFCHHPFPIVPSLLSATAAPPYLANPLPPTSSLPCPPSYLASSLRVQVAHAPRTSLIRLLDPPEPADPADSTGTSRTKSRTPAGFTVFGAALFVLAWFAGGARSPRTRLIPSSTSVWMSPRGRSRLGRCWMGSPRRIGSRVRTSTTARSEWSVDRGDIPPESTR